MTLNEIIGNRKTESKVDTELWKKMNEKYSQNNTTTPQAIEPKQKITLKNLERTVVNTATQREYDNLMQIYDAGEWKWYFSEDTSIEHNAWKEYRIRSCISIESRFTYSYVQYEEKKKKSTILSFNKFCETQKITQETIEKVNQYYDKNYPNRASKG
jgi:hypothetical protein